MLLRTGMLITVSALLTACYPPTYRDTGVVYEDRAPVYRDEPTGYRNDPVVYRDNRQQPRYDRDYGGYGYTDHELHGRVHEALRRDRYVHESGIQVHVRNGRVTLTGYVRDHHESRRAHDVAHGVPGVTNVYNRLTVS